MDLNKQIELLKQALEKTTKFDDEQEKIDYILDVTSQYKQLLLHSISNSLKVGMQTFDLCDCPYQINTWIEKYNIQADNIISINQDSKQVVLFYKAFNDC